MIENWSVPGLAANAILQHPHLPSHRTVHHPHPVVQYPEVLHRPLSLRATQTMAGLKAQLPASLLLPSPRWLQLLSLGGKNIRYVDCGAPKALPCAKTDAISGPLAHNLWMVW